MTEISPQTLTSFMRFFQGGDRAHGTHKYSSERNEKGKRVGETRMAEGEATEQNYSSHLSGNLGLGIVPIKSSGSVRFCVIDVDEYSQEVNRCIQIVYNYNLPLVPFRSKSGGVHLYLFFDRDVPASKAVEVLKKFVALLGINKRTAEIFPKQIKLAEGAKGNAINLPYFGLGEAFEGTLRTGLEGVTGRILPIDEALARIKNSVATVKSVSEFLETLPLADAPPCLQTIYVTGKTTHRDDYLFNLAIYFKNKYGTDDFEARLTEANNLLENPLSREEVFKTITSNKSKNYTYNCHTIPAICNDCDTSERSRRKFGGGKESDRVSTLNYEELTQYLADPPYYKWRIDGKDLLFYSEKDFLNQARFIELCVRLLGILPNKLSEEVWRKIIKDALEGMEKVDVDPDNDISTGVLFRDYLAEFLTRRVVARTIEQILTDRVFHDKENNLYIFRGKDLLKFIIDGKKFNRYGQTEIQGKLRSMGGKPTRIRMGKSQVRVWSLPFEALENYRDEPNVADVEIDHSENFENEPF